MNRATDRITVYYDGACSACIRDRRIYEKLAGQKAQDVNWLDITGRDQALRDEGIDPN